MILTDENADALCEALEALLTGRIISIYQDNYETKHLMSTCEIDAHTGALVLFLEMGQESEISIPLGTDIDIHFDEFDICLYVDGELEVWIDYGGI